MSADSDEVYYARRVAQELALAARAVGVNIKELHLNMAAQYATLRERAVAPRLSDTKK